MADRKRVFPRRPVKDRILERIRIDENGCWRWLGTKLPGHGYGTIGMGHANKRGVHRVAYEAWVGPVPTGLVIDHLCRVRDCCNPEHLEAVTPSVNTMRGDTLPVRKAAMTACPQGHPYDAGNTVWRKDNNGRRCKVCRNERERHRYAERKRAA